MMKKIKSGLIVVLGLFICLSVTFNNPSDLSAAVLEKDSNPVQMVFTEEGGVCLEMQGQEKYFAKWDGKSNHMERIPVPKSNIQSFDVEGNNLVYITNSDIYSTVMFHNLESGETKQLNTSFSSKNDIKISSQYVAWEDHGMGKADLLIYNLESGESVRIETKYSQTLMLEMNDKYAAYIDSNGDYRDICLYDLQSGEKTVIRSTQNAKASLSLSEDKLVWTEIRERGANASALVKNNSSAIKYYDLLWGNDPCSRGSFDIWIYDINSGSSSQLTNSSINQVQPVVWENYVAWVETGDGDPDLRLLDLNTGGSTILAKTDAYEVRPVMDYGKIAWITMRGNLADLNVESLSSDNMSGSESAEQEIKLIVNGQKYFLNPKPYIKDNRSMVPMRRIFEILGAKVDWNEAQRSVTASQGSREIILHIGSTEAYCNGQVVKLDAAPEIMPESGRTMVPLRFVSESLGCQVHWDDISHTITIDAYQI